MQLVIQRVVSMAVRNEITICKIDFRVLVEQPLYRRFLVGLAGEQPQVT